MNPRFTQSWLVAVICVAQVADALAVSDDFQTALNEAKERVFHYRSARKTNDAKAARDATLRLQEDPLAMRQVGSGTIESFKTDIAKDVAALQEEVKGLILTHLEESGIKRERVSFFDVIQPPWDMGFRIDLRVVPTRISQPFAREAYYELATGQKPPRASDQAARAEYREAAGKYGEQLALAWAGTSYDEQGNDGRRLIAGLDDARLRDLLAQPAYANADARQLAADLRTEGRLGTGVDQDIEELRQAMRQFGEQVRPQVEAAGAEVPQELAAAQAIVRQVDAGTMTPAQARDQIAATGQTPAAVTRRARQWNDTVQVLLPPLMLQAAGGVAPAPAVVFNVNVNRQLANRRLVRILQWVDAGLLTLAQARAQIGQINVQLQQVQNAVMPRPLANALTALLRAVAAGNAAAPRQALAQADPARLRAAGTAIADATMVPVPARTNAAANAAVTNGANNTGPRGDGQANLLSDAIRRQGQNPDVWSLPAQISQSEIADEEMRAAAEKRPPLYSGRVLNGALIAPGEALMFNTITQQDGVQTPASAILPGAREEIILAWVRSKLVENIKTMAGIALDLQWHASTADVNDQTFTVTLALFNGRYNNARLAMADLADRAGLRLGDKDPLVLALQKKVTRLGDPPKAADILKSREPELAAVPAKEGDKKPDVSKPVVASSQSSTPKPATPPVVMKVEPPMPVKIKVPDLIKLTKAEAEKKIAGLKLKLVANAGSDKPPRTATKGEVYRQSPAAGSEVAEGETVKLDYYAGFPVGKYVGLSKAAAEAAIQRDGLTAKVREGDPGKTATEGLLVYEQRPTPGAQAWFDDEIAIVYYKPMPSGFQDGDGAKIDPRVAAAKVHDGGAAEVACYKGASGSRGVLATPMPKNPGPNSSFHTFALLHFADADGAQAFYNQTAGPMTANQNMAGHKESITRVDGGVAYTRNMNLGGYKLTNHIRIVIYRGNFVIMYSMQEPNSAADVSHGTGIVERSKALIDLRFPAR